MPPQHLEQEPRAGTGLERLGWTAVLVGVLALMCLLWVGATW